LHPMSCEACRTPSRISTQRSTNVSKPWRR
jgi:hypothetical protein